MKSTFLHRNPGIYQKKSSEMDMTLNGKLTRLQNTSYKTKMYIKNVNAKLYRTMYCICYMLNVCGVSMNVGMSQVTEVMCKYKLQYHPYENG